MKFLNKRIMALCLSLVMLFSITACNGKTEKKPEETKATTEEVKEENSNEISKDYSFKIGKDGKVTDSAGREVQLPEKINKIGVAGNPAQMMMFTIAPEMLVGWGGKPSEEVKPYLSEELLKLPVIGTFYGKNADMNYEEMIKTSPDVIIDVGEVKKSMKEDLDGLQKQTGIPVIFVESMLDNTGDAYRTLGKLLDKEDTCNKQAEYIDTTLKDVKEKKDKIKEEVTVYYGRGDNGLQTNAVGTMHTEVLEYVGAKNVYENKEKSGQSWEEVSAEQLTMWDPEVILLSSGSIYDKVENEAVWKDLKAVKDKKVYEAPGAPYDWLGTPPNSNRIIGIKWLGNLLYPDIYDYDMKKETKDFYKLFYHADLTDEQVNELLAKSTVK